MMTGMTRKVWLIFLCVQIAGVVAMHLGPDWALVLGVVLLLPGLPGIYMSFGIHKLILIGDVRLAFAAVLVNAAIWQGVTLAIHRLRNRR